MDTADKYFPDCQIVFLIFLQSGDEKLQAWPGIEPATLNLSSRNQMPRPLATPS